jgi:hypothetical protein
MRKIILSGLVALALVVVALLFVRAGRQGSNEPLPASRASATALDRSTEVSNRTPAVEAELAPPIDVPQELEPFIEGRVLLTGGRPAPAGILVVALKETESWSAQSLQSAILMNSAADRGVTDGNGNFALRLASSGDRYDLVAGGKGYVCTKVVRGVPAGERDAVLHVERAYALWIRIREIGGAMPRAPGALFGSRYGTAEPASSGLTAVHGPSPQLVLAVGGESLTELSSYDRLYAYLAPSTEPEVGPVQLRLDWPGYEAAELTFMVPAVHGPIEERLLELKPVDERRAPVSVRWTGLPQELPPSSSLEPLAVLRLESEATGAFDLAVRSFSPQPESLGELPCGDYRVWSSPGSLPVRGVPEGEPTRMQLGPDGFTLTFDLSDKGWARLDFALPDGQLYEGRASILLGPGSSSEGLAAESRMFSGAPYLFGPLEPGVCFAYLDLPRMGDRTAGAARAAAVEFEVLPGVVTAATSQLASSR